MHQKITHFTNYLKCKHGPDIASSKFRCRENFQYHGLLYIKSKLRNKMKLELLEAILIFEFELIWLGKCCFIYQIPDHVLSEKGTSKVHRRVNQRGAS